MIRLTRMQQGVVIITPTGEANSNFTIWWEEVVDQIEASINEIIAAQEAAAEAAADAAVAQSAADQAQNDAITAQGSAISALVNAAAAQTTADSALGVATTAVQQDQAAAPSYSAYGGQTVGLVYSQAEAQQTDDAVKAASAAIVALIAALQAANVLT